MKMRCPAYPLISVDPYFNLWMMGDTATAQPTCHWTGRPNSMEGYACIDGTAYRFFGNGSVPAMQQQRIETDALSTRFVWEAAGVKLSLQFLSPLLPDRMEVFCRPVTYLCAQISASDNKPHQVTLSLRLSEEFVMDRRGEDQTAFFNVPLSGTACGRISRANPQPLAKSGDDLRIQWGSLYLAVPHGSVSFEQEKMAWLKGSIELNTENNTKGLFLLAYDDEEKALMYFHQPIPSFWTLNGNDICQILLRSLEQAEELLAACHQFSQNLYAEAEKAGGAQYAELCSLAYRQVIGAHKLAAGPDGELLFVSKECYSNGCAATVDVSYPSVPLFLRYCPELVKGMLRPVFRYAQSEQWPFDFAPHDAGRYPLLNGQVYSDGTDPKHQMPVEECGNILVMLAALSMAEKSAEFALAYRPLLEQWVIYLEKYGDDPAEQLCTDDFAGHLAHNCNLSLKAIMGVAGYGLICGMWGEKEKEQQLLGKARIMADSWRRRAAKGDGTYRLAFDQPESVSLKYNAVWDKVFGTQVFPDGFWEPEIASYREAQNRYGMPLDNRADYTKSDWLVWSACMTEDSQLFRDMMMPLWRFYHETPNRIPMTDWYETKTGEQVRYGQMEDGLIKIGFQNRTVQGGLFMKVLLDSGICHR